MKKGVKNVLLGIFYTGLAGTLLFLIGLFGLFYAFAFELGGMDSLSAGVLVVAIVLPVLIFFLLFKKLHFLLEDSQMSIGKFSRILFWVIPLILMVLSVFFVEIII